MKFVSASMAVRFGCLIMGRVVSMRMVSNSLRISASADLRRPIDSSIEQGRHDQATTLRGWTILT